MNQYVAIVTFPQVADAFKAESDLKASPVSSVIQAAALIQRAENGTISVPEGSDPTAGGGYVGGSLIGLLVGALGGPLGMLLGWGTGALIGGLADADKADDQSSVLGSMAKQIAPGNNALILQTEESDESALDQFVASHGGTINRVPLEQVVAELEAEEEAAKAAQKAASEELHKQRKQERQEKWDDRVAKLKAKFDGN